MAPLPCQSVIGYKLLWSSHGKKWVLSKIMINNHHEKKVELYILKTIISTGHTKTKNYNITFLQRERKLCFCYPVSFCQLM